MGFILVCRVMMRPRRALMFLGTPSLQGNVTCADGSFGVPDRFSVCRAHASCKQGCAHDLIKSASTCWNLKGDVATKHVLSSLASCRTRLLRFGTAQIATPLKFPKQQTNWL